MKHYLTLLPVFLAFALAFSSAATALGAPVSETALWPSLAPGEAAASPDVAGQNPSHFTSVSTPTIAVFLPENRASDACVLIFPGGGYYALMGDYEGTEIAEFWNSRGVAAAVLKYRVPRRPNLPKHLPAWQDAQRAVRWLRSKASELQINPEKIGCTGFSAGGHLTLMMATSSQTPAYAPVDELDKIPCHINFAIPVYPAYVLEDGKDGGNTGKGNASALVEDFAFDARTPPMCFIHGDADHISPMGSIAIYHQLRKMNIPAELHIYALKNHGLLNRVEGQDHADSWKERAADWFFRMERADWK